MIWKKDLIYVTFNLQKFALAQIIKTALYISKFKFKLFIYHLRLN